MNPELSAALPVRRYRLHPEIVFKKPVTGAAADELAAACPEVFSVANGHAVSLDARSNELHLEKVRSRCLECVFGSVMERHEPEKCVCCRTITAALQAAVLMHKHFNVQVRRLAADERWAGRLELRKRKDYFVFTVESTGALPPAALFARAVDVLADKADRLLQRL